MFIQLRGSECNVLKLLQRLGGDSIRFETVFCSSLITGMAMLLVNRSKVQQRGP